MMAAENIDTGYPYNDEAENYQNNQKLHQGYGFIFMRHYSRLGKVMVTFTLVRFDGRPAVLTLYSPL